jgi:hypothetical protein
VLRKPIKKGDQILTHYGEDRNNEELLISYGFVQWKNMNQELTIGWSLNDVPKKHITWTLEHVKHFVELMSLETYSSDSEDVKVQKNQELVASLLQGQSIEVTLTHEVTLPPSFLVLVGAMLSTCNTQDIQDLNNSNKPIASNGISATSTEVHAYMNQFFCGKLHKLINHLDGVVSDHYGNIVNRSLNNSGGFVYSDDDKEGVKIASLWTALVETVKRGVGNAVIGENEYAVLPDTCLLAYFDSQLSLLQHAAKDSAY